MGVSILAQNAWDIDWLAFELPPAGKLEKHSVLVDTGQLQHAAHWIILYPVKSFERLIRPVDP
jgi:hypothetical protein